MALKSIFKGKKKGNVVLDSLFYFVGIIVFIVVVVTGAWILNDVNTGIQADNELANISKTTMSDLNTNLPSWFDFGVVTVIVLLWALVLVASFYIDSHPIFFIISAIVLMIALAAINSFMEGIDDFFADPEISPTFNNFPLSSFIVTNIEKFIAFVGFTICIALYAKFKG